MARALALAKSPQDVHAAPNLLHPRMRLECTALGAVALGLSENEQALKRFFRSFADCRFT